MKFFLSTLVFVFVLSGLQPAIAQQADGSGLEFRKYRFTFVPGLSTNGISAPNYSAKYSLNIIAGYHGGLEGYELGLVNINKYYTKGFQIGGANISGGEMAGVNFAGLANVARGDMQGFQIAGLGNIATENVQGIQFSGLVNAGLQGVQGLQFAGVANIAAADIQGIQGAGVVNAAMEDLQGILMAGVGNVSTADAQGILMAGVLNAANRHQGISIAGVANIARDMQGVQMAGAVNLADKGEGIQLGVVNLAREFDGVPIGIISFYGDGRKNLDVWADESGYINAGLKLGTKRVYNMISAGYNSLLNEEDVWSFGWSFGVYAPLEDAWNNERYEGYFRMKDVTIRGILEGNVFWEASTYSFRYLLGKEFGNNLGIYAGPTLNLLIADEDSATDYSSYSMIDTHRWGHNYKLWLGFTIGAQMFGN